MMEAAFFKVLASEVRRIRDDRVLTTEGLVRVVKVSYPTMKKVVDGDVVSARTVRKVVEKLELDFADLRKKEAHETMRQEALAAGSLWRPVARISRKVTLMYFLSEAAGVGLSFMVCPKVFGIPMTGSMQPAYGLMVAFGMMFGSVAFSVWLPFSKFAGDDAQVLEVRVRLPLRAWLIRKILRR